MGKPSEKSESRNNEKAQLPKGVLYTFYLGVRSFWAPVDVASTWASADAVIKESKELCKKDKELAELSRRILSKSP
ncbi:MAG TPA: hypothetical protein VD770_04465 [Coxiellaceae bacterium]|nr:hypothetical protein [Coxiellaceae bacterium]